MQAWFEHEDHEMLRVCNRLYQIIPSTQILARDCAVALQSKPMQPDQWLRITAEGQTKGMGQYGRTWISPANFGNIYATYLIPIPKQEITAALLVPQTIALAIALALEAYGFNPQIKWINDLFLENKKLGGILCEYQKCTNDTKYDLLILGIGLNVNLHPSSITDTAMTSLYMVSGQKWDKNRILNQIQTYIFYQLKQLIKNKFCEFYMELNKRLYCRGKSIYFEHHSKIYQGVLHGIMQDGKISLQIGGNRKSFSSGKIILPIDSKQAL